MRIASLLVLLSARRRDWHRADQPSLGGAAHAAARAATIAYGGTRL